VIVNRSDVALELTDFFCQIMQSFLDTYMVTLLAIEQLCGKNITLKEDKFVKELHVALKHLYQERAIPYLHSCLQEIIRNSLSRYSQMGIVSVRAYSNKKGSLTQFITCSGEQISKVQELIEFLHDIRPTTQIQTKVIEQEILLAIQRAQGPLPLGRL
jgi:hypothetical protein